MKHLYILLSTEAGGGDMHTISQFWLKGGELWMSDIKSLFGLLAAAEASAEEPNASTGQTSGDLNEDDSALDLV